MTDYYVDSNTGDNGDTGATQALAWASIEYALEFGGLGDGDTAWVRRTHTETPTSDISPANDGDIESPLKIIGWPRAAIPDSTITQGDWTNGSNTVDNIVGLTLARTSHQARYCTAPDGKIYVITRIVDTNTLMIDRLYPGTTVTGTDGAFQIEADEDYATRPADVDGWDSDAHTIPIIDWNEGAYKIVSSTDYCYCWKNIEISDSEEYDGQAIAESSLWTFINCLFHINASDYMFNFGRMFAVFRCCTFEGNGSGSGQAFNGATAGAYILIDSAIYNMGDIGIYVASSTFYLENVNIGVEIANGDDDCYFRGIGSVYGRDVALGGTNGLYTSYSLYNIECTVQIENYNKVLGASLELWQNGQAEKVAVSGETPNKKVSDNVLKVSPSLYYSPSDLSNIDARHILFSHEFEATTDSKTYKYWIYNDLGVTINDVHAKEDIFLVAEYIDSYSAVDEYHFGKVYSTQIDILDAADADDWDYLQVTVQPAVASKVRIKLISAFDGAFATDIFIDPSPVIS